MKVLRPILIILGTLAVLMGLLWIGQGTGLVMWPRQSFMLAERQWAWNGAILAGIGAVFLYLGRRR
jgi:hypothetical protein